MGSGIGGYDKVHNVFIENGFLYEADSRTNKVKVFDVQTPDKPIFVRDIVTTDSVLIHDITVINSRLYSSGWGGTTDIYDVSNIGTSAPVLLGSISTGSNSHSNWVSADGTLLASAREISGGGIRLYDISNPASPVLTSTITAAPLGIDGTTAHNPVIFGDYLFVTWYQAGLQMFDISDPFNPLHVGAFDTFPRAVSNPDGNWGVYPFLGTDRILLSDVDGGLFVVRLLQADLVVSGIDMPDPVVEGFQLVYTIDITNNGPDPASNVILTDELPAGVGYVQATPTQGNCNETGGTVTCLLGLLADGASATVTVMVTAITPGSWNNALSVIADENDSNLTDNEVTLNSTVLPDQDGDGLDDDLETSIGTNPLLPDTDGDGLSDGDEVLVYGTNPTQRDGDGDGFGDDVELGVGTNANDPAGPWPSADGDLAPVGRYDGLVNVADYLVAQRMALGLIPQTALDIAHGDLQTTGTSADVIDTADVLLILQQVLNQP